MGCGRVSYPITVFHFHNFDYLYLLNDLDEDIEKLAGLITEIANYEAQFKANKYKARADKRTNVAVQTTAARYKAESKANKWAKKMDKYIKDTKTSELSNDQIALGRKYALMYS